MAEALRRTPLHAQHIEAGARLVPFAGYEMPVQYHSIVAEHRAVREHAGLFDVSHMGELRIRGRDAIGLAERVFSNTVAGTGVGRVRYGLLCQEDGGVIDDVLLYRVAEDDVLLCVNAANTAADLAWIREVHEASGLDCEVVDESEATALLAIQGPRALAITARALGDSERPPKRWRFRSAHFAGAEIWLSRTGYTGEDGFEIYAPSECAPAIWEALLAAGEDQISPAGLGARDTLRTEMAYPLYGHELDRAHTPIEAGLERFLAFGSGFIGEAALEAERSRGPERCLVGVVLEGRGVARADYPIIADGPIGRTTSGGFAPSVERSIAIGYVPDEYAAPGTPLYVEIRGRKVACTVTPTPFYNRKS